MATPIRIDPLDLEADVAIGIDLPMIDSVGTRFRLNYTSMDQVSANARNLLLTNRGERLMLPDFGCDLRKSLFQQLTATLVSETEQKIRESFAYWLPHVVINELTLTPSYDQNQLSLRMIVSLAGNKFDTRSIELTLKTNG